MKEFEINPLNLIGERKLSFLPPHFKVVEVPRHFLRPMFDIENWITFNLSGRYYSGRLAKLVDNRVIEYMVVAFEDPKEATFFLLKNTGQN